MREKEVSVSIIIPAFEIDKSEPILRDLLKQDYANKEIIIINDNPKSQPSKSTLKFFVLYIYFIKIISYFLELRIFVMSDFFCFY